MSPNAILIANPGERVEPEAGDRSRFTSLVTISIVSRQ